MALQKAKMKTPKGFSWEPTPVELEMIKLVKKTADMTIYNLPETIMIPPPPAIIKRPTGETPSTNLIRFYREDQMVN